MPTDEKPAEAAPDATFLSGGGEMGALMRSIRWDDTPLGPARSWSPALRTLVGVLLRSQFPMIMLWGPSFIQLYNDAYRPMLGDKHPRSMGQACHECWSEIWPIVGPMIEAPFRGEPATWSDDMELLINRRGFFEECHFKAAYNPVPDDTILPTGIGGVIAPVAETTEKVYAERQLRVLRELGMQTANEKTPEEACRAAAATLSSAPRDVPFALFYLLDDAGQSARLAGSYGFVRAEELAATEWMRDTVLGERRIEVIDGLSRRFGDRLAVNQWNAQPSRAVVLPLASPDQPHAYGFVVAGTSPHRALDEDYRTFFELAAAQVVTAIRNARAYQEERRRAEALAALDKAKTAFFSNVSHEFRTPLTLMLGPIEDSLQDPEQPLPPRQRERQEVVRRSSLRLLKLVNTLLDFSRIEAGRAQAHYQPTDLSAFTADLASSFRSLVERAGLTLAVDCPPMADPVYVDRGMYEKIVLNLLSNAFKFTFDGGIRVTLESAGDGVRLVVADTGTGIPEPELAHVFERFHRVEGARGRSYEGSGIGLALVQELAKLHGGSISVESRLGEGSRFAVSLPRGKAHLQLPHIEAAPRMVSTVASTALGTAPFLEEASQWVEAERDIPAVSPADPPPATDAGHILFADDNADMRQYVRQLLVAQGWHVDMAGDGEAALQLVSERVPDLILADVMMPKLDGFGLLRALREDSRTHLVPVILLSARAGEEARVEGLDAGADDYLVKPFAARELLARVRTQLNTTRTRKEAARASEAARTTAEEERAKMQGLLGQVPAIVNFLRGPDLVWEFAHPAAIKILGGRELLGKPLLETLGEYRDVPFAEMLVRVYRTGETLSGREALLKIQRSGTGTLEASYWNFTYLPVRNAAGAVEGVMTFDIEVTDHVLARKKVEALMEQLKLADQRKDEFLAMLAHELRNPMAAISMSLSMLELTEGDPAKTANHRETARRQMANLVRLVDDLLDVSRITRGEVELRKEEVDLATLVQNALTAARPAIEARGHELSVTLAPGAFRMEADATRLEQVVVNLLTNAAKYTEPGGSLSIRLSQEAADGGAQAVLRVRDTGRGMPAEMLDKVFDLFVQVSPSIDRSAGGLGLGLTLVRRLVEMHGGSVVAHSDGPGQGSEFVVRLPLAKRAAIHTEVHGKVEAQRPVPLRKRRVLLVEDSDDVRNGLKAFLEFLGHEVAVARDGLEGAARLLELRPDVSLVDVGLPGIDGYELARRVRAAPGGEELYLVALTGYSGPEAKAKAEGAGFDLHLTKPVDIRELPHVVSRSKMN